jgi:hypothetical protein
VSAPGQQLVGDIAYLPTWEGWLRLAVVIDCHTKMLFVQGPGRVGKTALPGAIADRAAASGRVVVRVDGHDVRPLTRRRQQFGTRSV